MDLYIKNAKAYIDGEFVDSNVTVINGKIAAMNKKNIGLKEFDCAGNYLCPGFIDVHTHGANGVDVNLASTHDFEKLANFFSGKGTTSYLASVLTDTEENTLRSLNNIKEYKITAKSGANLLGAHLEGPFLSPLKKGAMPEKLLRKADCSLLKKYVDTGVVKYVTVAPEVEGNIELIKKFSNKTVFAMGHSAADYGTALKAKESGVMASTHTFNGMLGIDRVNPNILGAVMDMPIYNEIISDGVHVHPSNIRLLHKAKGKSKIIAITDSIMATGLPDGNYSLGGWDVTVNSDDAFLSGTSTRAGSVLTMDKSFKNMLKFLNETPENILPMYTENPAKMLNLNKGFIKETFDADFTVLNKSFDVVNTIVNGAVQL